MKLHFNIFTGASERGDQLSAWLKVAVNLSVDLNRNFVLRLSLGFNTGYNPHTDPRDSHPAVRSWLFCLMCTVYNKCTIYNFYRSVDTIMQQFSWSKQWMDVCLNRFTFMLYHRCPTSRVWTAAFLIFRDQEARSSSPGMEVPGAV